MKIGTVKQKEIGPCQNSFNLDEFAFACDYTGMKHGINRNKDGSFSRNLCFISFSDREQPEANPGVRGRPGARKDGDEPGHPEEGEGAGIAGWKGIDLNENLWNG